MTLTGSGGYWNGRSESSQSGEKNGHPPPPPPSDAEPPGPPLRWRYIPLDFSDGPFWLPSDVLGQDQIQGKGIRLHVEGLPLLSSKEKYQDFYLKSIPSELLVSLELAHPMPPLTTRLHSLKELLLASPHLETLHYRDKGQGTHFSFTGSERLPPLKDLVLESYDWNHDKHSVATHWDFSRIRSLALLSVPIHSFLTSVPPTSLAALHTLHASDFSAHHHHHHHPGPPDHRLSATLDLAALVSTHICALVDLRLTCHVSLFPPSALLRHAASLRRLSLRDHVGFADDDRRCPTLPASDLEVLAGALDRLTALELDMDFDDDDHHHHQQRRRFLLALCHFPALRTLTLHTQTVLRPTGCCDDDDDDDDDDNVPAAAAAAADPDRDAAARTFAFLVRNRGVGVGGGDVPVPWQRVTLNVGTGGAVARRVGEGWRGVMAKRCFVLERAEGSGGGGGGGGGGFVFREEGGGRG